MIKKIVIFLIAFVATMGVLIYQKQSPHPIQPPAPQAAQPEPQIQKPKKPSVTNKIPGYQDYNKVCAQLEEWHNQAPDLTEIGTYGKSTKGRDLKYIKLYNKFNASPKKKILITACIHGNEPLSASTVMACIGTMLGTYEEDKEVTSLIDNSEIYFVPVFSPDSYPNSRHVDGVDPNRNFPGPSNPNHQSVPPVKAIQDFFLKHNFNAVISGHTFGRVLLCPYGDKNDLCPNSSDYDRIIGQMSGMCQYGKKRACQVYGTPIHGSEVDWYYRHGAFAIVMEFGTHQQIPSINDVKTEFDKTYKGILFFMKEAPKVQIKPSLFSILRLDQVRPKNQEVLEIAMPA